MKIGVDLGGSHIAIGVVDNKGRIVEKMEKRITSTEKRNIKKSIEEYIVDSTLLLDKKYKVTKMGIGVPGIIENDVILFSGNLGIKNYAIKDVLQSQLSLPLKVRNDAKCAALAEKEYGCLKSYKRCIFLTLGTRYWWCNYNG